MSIRLEELRLKRAFGAAIIAAIPSLAIGACGHDSTLTDNAADARDDHTTISTIDGTTTNSSDSESAEASADAACAIAITLIDSGIDGDAYVDPGCTYVNSCGLPTGVVTLGCQVYVQSGEQPDVITPNGCWVIEEAGCENDVYAPAAPFIMQCPDCTSSGRSTRGVRPPRAHSHATIHGFFAAMAHAEAASVIAFETLRRELEHHHAPRALLQGCARATRDEVRHTQMMSALAGNRGTRIARATRRAPRSLIAIARENAIEGCTRETFGALLMQARARLTPDAKLKRVFTRIASDETRHAALSFEIAKWIEPQLPTRSRKSIHESRAEAQARLETSVRLRSPSEHDARLGYPAVSAHVLAKSLRALDRAC